MNPELPQVEMNKDEILKSLEGQYGEEGSSEKSKVNIDAQELTRVGSIGIEAGLKNFEGDPISDDSGTSDDDSTDDRSLSGEKGLNDLKRVAGAVAVSQAPLVAEHRDDIEREWVSKAKKIVEQTKGDPFLQERAVSRLQADYMKKRFDKQVGLPSESR